MYLNKLFSLSFHVFSFVLKAREWNKQMIFNYDLYKIYFYKDQLWLHMHMQNCHQKVQQIQLFCFFIYLSCICNKRLLF
jgi:hypothetical protein